MQWSGMSLSRPAIDALMAEVVAAGLRRRHTYATPVDLMQTAGLAPDAWQREFLLSTHHQIILNCCRQSGKSTTTAAVALWTAATKPDALILCVAPALRQSQELFRKIMDAYRDAPGLPAIRNLSALRVELANGSRVAVLPDQERTIRGYSNVTMVIIDEASGVRDETYYTLRPMLAVARGLDETAGRVVLLSTPRGQRGFFYETWKQSAPDWLRIRVTAPDVPRITPEFLAEEERELGRLWYRQEYFGEFLAPANAVFDFEAIDRAASGDVVPLMESPLMRGVVQSWGLSSG